MNIVIDDAAEVYVKDVKPRRELGSLHLPQSSLHSNFCVSRTNSIKRGQHYADTASQLTSEPLYTVYKCLYEHRSFNLFQMLT